jgi:ABC superfamily ATP binding cassette transporter permease protein
MKWFHYHREFWMDFHFWILVLLLVAVTLTMQTPLSVVSLSYLAFVGILILLQVFQPPVSTRKYTEGSYHFNWTFYRDIRLYTDLFVLAGLLAGPIASSDMIYWILLGAVVGSIGFVLVVKEKTTQKMA